MRVDISVQEVWLGIEKTESRYKTNGKYVFPNYQLKSTCIKTFKLLIFMVSYTQLCKSNYRVIEDINVNSHFSRRCIEF